MICTITIDPGTEDLSIAQARLDLMNELIIDGMEDWGIHNIDILSSTILIDEYDCRCN